MGEVQPEVRVGAKFGLSYEDAQDKDDWRLRIKEATN